MMETLGGSDPKLCQEIVATISLNAKLEPNAIHKNN